MYERYFNLYVKSLLNLYFYMSSRAAETPVGKETIKLYFISLW